MSNYKSMMAFPSVCLEFVRLRLKNGYYRHLVAAIVNDLQEAYVTTCLFSFLAFLPGFAEEESSAGAE
jgi:hypothetical protein